MPEDDQEPANPDVGLTSDDDVKDSAPTSGKTDQEKAPEGHKTILIGKAFVVGGAAIRIDKIPKKAKGGQGIVIHGLNLKVYDGLALFVAGAWYKPINLHLARIDGQAIEFTLPNFNKILSEGNDIWIRLSSSHFPQANGTLNKYIAYTFKDEEEAEEGSESRAKKEEEKKKAGKDGGVGGKGLAGLAEASVASVLGNLAEPFLPAFLKKDNALSDAKSALKSGDKKALKDAVNKSKELKDLDGLKDLLKEAKDSESEKLIRGSISDLENKALVPEKLESSEVARITGGDAEGEVEYIDDESPEVQQAEKQENSARLDLHQQQEQDKKFAGKFEAEAGKEKKPEFLPENIKQSSELIGEYIDKNPGLIPDTRVREKVLEVLATGNLSSLDKGYIQALQKAMSVSGGASSVLAQAILHVKGALEQNFQVQTSGTQSGQVVSSGAVTGQASSQITTSVSGSGITGQTQVGAQVQGSALGETKAEVSGTVTAQGTTVGSVETRVSGTQAGQAEVSGTVSGQTSSEETISAPQASDSGESKIQTQTISEVSIKGDSGLNRQVEAKLQEEKSGAVAGAGSKISKKVDLGVQQSVLSADKSGGSEKEPSKKPEAGKNLEAEVPGQDKGQTTKPIGDFKKPAGQAKKEEVVGQKQDTGAVEVSSETSADVGQKPEPEQVKPSSAIQPSQEQGPPPSSVPPKTLPLETSEPKQPLDLPKAERKYPRRPFKDTRSLNDLMSAAIKGKEDLSKHPSAWQTVKRIAEKKLARPGAGVGGRGGVGPSKSPTTAASGSRPGPPGSGAEGIIGSSKVGERPTEGQRQEGLPPDLSKEDVSKPESSIGEPAQKPIDQESESPKQQQEESPVSRIASKAASEPGVGQAASQATSKVWWYGFDTSAAVFFSGLDFMIGAIVMDAYWIFGHRKDKNIFPLKTWQKAVTIFANIAPLIYIAIILIILLVVGCETPIVNKMIGDDICNSVKSTTNKVFYNGVDNGLPTQGGVLSTGKWTNQINQAAANNTNLACILRVVVQKESQGIEDIIGCDCAANGRPEQCPAGARSRYYSGYPFNWDQCSYGIGITQWTIYKRSSSASWNRWENASTPSRNLFGDRFYRLEEFLDPQTSLNLTARKFSSSLSSNGNNVAGAFRDYAGPGAPQSWVDQRMTLYNMCISSTGGGN